MKLSIGQVSKLFDISMDTLRHYDKIGLLKPETNPDNNYRYYDTSHLDQVSLILGAKSLGIPLSQIKDTMESGEVNEYKKLMTTQEELVSKKISHLKRVQKELIETQKLIDKVLSFENNYNFKTLTEKKKIDFYGINMKNFFGGDKYREYVDIFEDDERKEEFFSYYTLKDEEIICNEKFIYFKESKKLSKYIKSHKLKVEKITFDKELTSVHFCGTYEELEDYLKKLFQYFNDRKEAYLTFKFYMPKGEYELYFCEILF
ncbi:MAG: MerR family transcriptional regulator [Clostridium sp.]